MRLNQSINICALIIIMIMIVYTQTHNLHTNKNGELARVAHADTNKAQHARNAEPQQPQEPHTPTWTTYDPKGEAHKEYSQGGTHHVRDVEHHKAATGDIRTKFRNDTRIEEETPGWLERNIRTDQPGRILAVFVFAPILFIKSTQYQDNFIHIFSTILFTWDLYWLLLLPARIA